MTAGDICDDCKRPHGRGCLRLVHRFRPDAAVFAAECLRVKCSLQQARIDLLERGIRHAIARLDEIPTRGILADVWPDEVTKILLDAVKP